MSFIEFEPIYKERIWGGRRLEESLGRILPNNKMYGESWELVDREKDQSIVHEGKWKGLKIRQLLHENSAYIMGPSWPNDKPFPILVKWLDCHERLSVQVHPPKELEKSLEGQSKTESWYIAEADPGACVFAGLKNKVTREDFLKAIGQENLEPCLHKIPTQKGDSLFIPSGRLHTVGGGNLIFEIQENSDTTYRVYDWGRLGLDRQPRSLHIHNSLLSINFKDFEPSKIAASNEDAILACCSSFRIQKKLVKSYPIEIKANQEPRILSIVEGNINIKDAVGSAVLSKGSTVLLPYSESFILEPSGSSTILITDTFVNP